MPETPDPTQITGWLTRWRTGDEQQVAPRLVAQVLQPPIEPRRRPRRHLDGLGRSGRIQLEYQTVDVVLHEGSVVTSNPKLQAPNPN